MLNTTFSKKTLITVSIIFSMFGYGQVGIGTVTPQQQLHIAGTGNTIRIDDLNQTNQPAKHNGIDTVPVHVTANGDLVLGQNPEIALDINAGGTFMNPAVRIETDVNTTTHETLNTGLLATVNFNVSKRSLVEINSSVAVRIFDENDDVITDNISRMYGVAVYVDGVRLFEDAKSYSNGATSSGLLALSTPNYSVGPYNCGGNSFIVLDAGNHTIELYGYVGGSYRPPTLGVLFGKYFQAAAFFGGDFSFLKVVQHN